MKDKKGILILVILIGVGLFYYFSRDKSKEATPVAEVTDVEPTETPETPVVNPTPAPPVVPGEPSVVQNAEGLFVKIDIERSEDQKTIGAISYNQSLTWPKLSGNYPPEILESINRSLNSVVLDHGNACNPQMEGDYEDPSGPEEDEEIREYHDRIIATGEVKGPDLVFVKFVMESQCGSTPYNRIKNYWYDLKDGKMLSPNDLFKGADQLSTLMKTKLAGPLASGSDECKELLNYTDCKESGLDEDGLVFMVGQNCLPPSMRETCSFDIKTPFSELQDQIPEKSPFRRMLK